MMEKSSIHRIISRIKRYLGLQREYVMLSFAEKLTVLLTALIVGAIMMLVCSLVLIFLSLAVSSWLSDVLGSDVYGYGIVALFYLVCGAVFYANRRNWIANPIANALVTMLVGEKHHESDADNKNA